MKRTRSSHTHVSPSPVKHHTKPLSSSLHNRSSKRSIRSIHHCNTSTDASIRRKISPSYRSTSLNTHQRSSAVIPHTNTPSVVSFHAPPSVSFSPPRAFNGPNPSRVVKSRVSVAHSLPTSLNHTTFSPSLTRRSFTSLSSSRLNDSNNRSISISSSPLSTRKPQTFGSFAHVLFPQARFMSDHAETGVTPPTQQEDTIFGKISRGEIPVPLVHQDDLCVVINDISPQAKVHMLVIPKKPITQLSKSSDDDAPLLGHLLNVARKVADERGLEGYRIVINNGKDGCQSVYHLHVHVLGGEQLTGRFGA